MLLPRIVLWSLRIAVVVSAAEWPVPAADPDGAFPDCPCLDLTGNSSLNMLFPSLVQVIDGNMFIRLDSKGVVPVDYGSSRCNDWDSSRHSYSVCASNEKWCEDKWCFVDAANCKRRWVNSVGFSGLAYSYQTCGYLNRYLSPALQPNRSQPVYSFSFGRRLDVLSKSKPKFLSMFLQFATQVLPRAGILLDTVRSRSELSNASRQKYSSTFTACVYDIGLGNIDLCLGDFWDTSERQAFGAAKFVPIDTEPIILVAPQKDTTENLWDLVVKPFRPFSGELWALVAAVIIAVGFAMILFEYGRNEGDFGNRSVTADILKSMYLSMSSAINAGVCFTPVTVSGRLVSMGYSIFILIAIASFTAETASLLIKKKLGTTIASIEDALFNGKAICYSSGMKAMVEAKYDRMANLGVPLDTADFGGFVSAINADLCDFALVGELWPDDAWEAGENCNFNFVGAPILSFPTGYWVSDDLYGKIGWAVSTQRSAGSFGKIQTEFQTKRRCEQHASSASSTSNTSDDDGGSFTLVHNIGILLILSLCIALAALFRCVESLYWGAEQEDRELLHQVQHVASQHLGLQEEMQNVVHGKATVDCFERLSSCFGDTLKKIEELEASVQHALTQHPELEGHLEEANIEDLQTAAEEIREAISEAQLRSQHVLDMLQEGDVTQL